MYVLLKKRSKGQNHMLYDTFWLRKEVKEVNRYIFAYISLKKHWKCIQETNKRIYQKEDVKLDRQRLSYEQVFLMNIFL